MTTPPETLHLPKSLRSAIAAEATRYATDTVRLLPSPENGEAFAESTDGRQAAIAVLEGTLTKPFILSKGVLPTNKAGLTATITRGDNGATVTTTTKAKHAKVVLKDFAEPSGQFPPIAGVMPELPHRHQGDPVEPLLITIDAEVLLKVARALTHDQDKPPKVTLIINPKSTKNWGPIPLVGNDGIGVVCTCSNNHDAAVATYNFILAKYRNGSKA